MNLNLAVPAKTLSIQAAGPPLKLQVESAGPVGSDDSPALLADSYRHSLSGAKAGAGTVGLVAGSGAALLSFRAMRAFPRAPLLESGAYALAGGLGGVAAGALIGGLGGALAGHYSQNRTQGAVATGLICLAGGAVAGTIITSSGKPMTLALAALGTCLGAVSGYSSVVRQAKASD